MTHKTRKINVQACVEDLKGKVLKSCKVNSADTEIIFITEDGEEYRMLHYQDCCESVYIESIVGSLEDLVGSPILFAAESTNSRTNPDYSQTWTSYKFATIKGWVGILWVGILWVGESNGYCSKRVDFVKIEDHISY